MTAPQIKLILPCAAPTATLFRKQNPLGVSSPQWCPGGLIDTKARSAMTRVGWFVEFGRVDAITVSTASHTVPTAACMASTDVGQTTRSPNMSEVDDTDSQRRAYGTDLLGKDPQEFQKAPLKSFPEIL